MVDYPIVFLDIDGVLNTHDFDPTAESAPIHRDKVVLLNAILVNTDARVVVSSAWRYLVHRGDMSLTGLDWLLRSHGMLSNRLVGITRPDTMVLQPDGEYRPEAMERGRQITDWRAANSHTEAYVVIDDMDLGITDAGHPWVETLPDVGLRERDITLAVEILMSPLPVPEGF